MSTIKEVHRGDGALFTAIADLAMGTLNSMFGMPLIEVDLDAIGGNVAAGMRVAKIVRNRSMLTFAGST